MKHTKLKTPFCLILCLALLFSLSVSANAAMDASPVFVGGHVIVDNDLSAELHAQTKYECDDLGVASVDLHRVNSNGSITYSVTPLPLPTSTFGDSIDYYGWIECGGYAVKGSYYRLCVTFIADGMTMTITSRIVQYQ